MKKFYNTVLEIFALISISIPITYFYGDEMLKLINEHHTIYIGAMVALLLGFIYDLALKSTLRPKIKKEKSGALRRDFNIIREEIERSQRYDYTMSIVILQIVGLDELKDKYESPVETIVHGLVGQLKSLTRHSDILMRFRSDQILIMLSNTDQPGSKAVSQKLANYINHNDIDGFQVNVNVGYAQYFNKGSAEDLIKEALTHLKGDIDQ